MKKKFLFFLMFVISGMCVFLPEQTDAASDTLTVQTRSGEYVFHVGDTFTYNYWLDLSPDVLSQLGLSDSDTLSLLTLGTLDDVSGNILFDTSHLQVVEKSMPNFHSSIALVYGDKLDIPFLDGTLFDFTNGDLFFKARSITRQESDLFHNRSILVSVRFQVTSGSNVPVYLRTKLKKLDVVYGSKEIFFIDDKNSIAVLPFASYESIDSGQPGALLSPYVGDQAFDIRCIRTLDSTESFLRPGAGVAVTVNGVSAGVEHLILTQYTTGEDVFWFYDVPYGEYFVSCSYTSETGTKYETPKITQGEYVSIPSTGVIQALWLFETAPQTLTLPDCPVSDGVAYADGETVPFSNGTVALSSNRYKTLVICTYSDAGTDGHRSYPTHMYVWTLSRLNDTYIATRHSALDDVLSYAGTSIRISGNKGIRMITGIPETVKAGLIAGHVDGFTLMECGTMILWDSDLGGNDFTLDVPRLKIGKAYQRNIADPVFCRTNGTAQYTNVLVGFTNEQCVPDLLMRPYMILQNSLGESITLYGGITKRSIGYIACQNRNTFSPGSNSYNYIWDIIHYVYGDAYDADYVR